MTVSPLKTSYQKSIIAGLLASSLAMIAAAIFLSNAGSLERPVKIRTDKSIYTIVWAKSRDRSQDNCVSESSPPAETSNESNAKRTMPETQDIDSHHAVNESPVPAGFSLAQYTTGAYGMNMNITVPTQNAPEFVPMPGNGLTYGANSDGTRDMEMPFGNMSHQPLFIKLFSLKAPDECKVRQDTVIVLLNIDDKAQIKSIETIYDSNPGNGFDTNFKNAIRYAHIRPEIKDGLPVGGSYYLCWIWGEHGRVGVKNAENIRIQLVPINRAGF